MDDPATYYFTQGVLGITVLVLGLVVRTIYKELQNERKEKIAILEAWRLETKTEGKDALDIVKGNSQSLFYLADKIEAAKAKGQTQ